MSTLGAAGWSAIGRQYGIWWWRLFVVFIVMLALALIRLILWAFGLWPMVQWVLEQIILVLGIIGILMMLGLMATVGWTFIKDLAHNFYTSWKTGGPGAAAKGLLADIGTCGGALAKSAVSAIRERADPVISGIKKFFGF